MITNQDGVHVDVTDLAITRAQRLIKKGEQLVGTSQPPPSSTLGFPSTVDTQLFFEWKTQTLAFLEGLLGNGHVYVRNFEKDCINAHTSDALSGSGILRAVMEDLERGYLSTLSEIIHANTFSDFLEMASYLLSDGGYKDAAAVMAGGVLEAHLRNLCQKSEIDTERQTSRGSDPKKADTLNADLAREGVYSKLDQKSVTAWLDIRNNAAHGQYDAYKSDQVALLIQGIRDFITRHPA